MIDKIKYIVFQLFLLVLLFITELAFAQSNNTLWYNKPAEYFEEALALGNGRIGATVFGGVQSDQIYLNDATLWAGEPVDPNMNPDAYKNISAIREALLNLSMMEIMKTITENLILAKQLRK